MLSAEPGAAPDWGFLLSPALAGSALLVAAGIVWHGLTGRGYPLPRADEIRKGSHGTADTRPAARHLPAPRALGAILARLELETTLAPSDLARLIEAAEAESAAGEADGGLTARELMSRDLVTVTPETALPVLAGLFATHRFKTLPVVDAEGHFRGLVPLTALAGIADPALTAAGLADPAPATCPPETPLATLIDSLGDGRAQCLAVTEGGRLLGLVTRSDLLATLIERLAHRG